MIFYVEDANRPHRIPISEIRNTDCVEGMKTIADNSISLILTDPPYFIDGMDDKWNKQKLDSRIKKGVIGSIPAGMKFDRNQSKNLYNFMLPIAKQWYQIIKPGGFVLCFANPRLSHKTASAIEDAGFEIRDLLAWKYEGQPKAFTQDHFVRKYQISEKLKQRIINELDGRKTPQLKPQMETIILAQRTKEGTFVDNWMVHKTGLIDVKTPYLDSEKFPGNIIEVSKPREKYGHIAAKPVDLLRHLIRIFSYREGVVLDTFAGSGSTGVAAKLEGRDFIGFEIDEEMASIAESRISKIQ